MKAQNKSSFVVNAFQTPNAYIDDVMPHLTGEEFKVLIYAVRRILGFQKRQDRISISQFTDGIQNSDGEVLDEGTGLSIATVKKCLANLVSFNLMIRLEENDSKTNEGVLWGLQWDSDKVNWAALEERENKRAKVYRKKMKKARSMRQTPANGIERTPANGIEGGSGNGIETQKTVERQGKKESPPKKLDPIDGIIRYQLKPQSLRQAFADFFKLTPNWDAKYNRQFLEWLVEVEATPDQIKAAAELWGKDKRFNWAVPTLKGIQ
jgi:hypothetical protein